MKIRFKVILVFLFLFLNSGLKANSEKSVLTLNNFESAQNNINDHLAENLRLENLHKDYEFLEELEKETEELYYNYHEEKWNTEEFFEYSEGNVHFEEIMVRVNFQNYLNRELNVVFSNGDILLPLLEIFEILKIKKIVSPELDSVSGFVSFEDNPYLIDLVNGVIKVNGTEYKLKRHDLVRTINEIYLKSKVFEDVFSFRTSFNYRNLSVYMSSLDNTPLFRDNRLSHLRQNLSQNSQYANIDHAYRRNYSLFKFGVLDWTLSNIYGIGSFNQTYARLGIGGELAAGELNAQFYYNSLNQFNLNEQIFNWRYVNNNNKVIRQARLGNIAVAPVSSIYGNVIGFQITNSLTYSKGHFGTYNISDYTQAEWIVELYINNNLVEYVKADESGFYSFDIPLNYGMIDIKLKFYGPFGEEKVEERKINIPHTFVPVGKLEYSLSGGKILSYRSLEDDENDRYILRYNMNYGISHWITAGAGTELILSVDSVFYLPFSTVSMSFSDKLQLTNEYAYNTRNKTNLNYKLSPKVMLNAYYTKYTEGQTAIRKNYISEKGLTVFLPLNILRLNAFIRFKYDHIELAAYNYNNANLMFSTNIYGVNTRFSVNTRWFGTIDPISWAEGSLSFKIKNLQVRTSSQYDLSRQEFLNSRLIFEKNLFNFLKTGISFNYNHIYEEFSGEVRFRFDLPFAIVNTSYRNMRDHNIVSASLSGGLLIDPVHANIKPVNYNSLGKGIITFRPFIDLNNNGVWDEGEPVIEYLEVKSNGGNIFNRKGDNLIHVSNLEPFIDHYITLELIGDYDLSWQLKYNKILVTVDPNQYKTIDIPVQVINEVSGKIIIQDNGTKQPLDRILVFIEDINDENKKYQSFTNENGLFYFESILPGNYKIYLLGRQLEKLKLKSEKEYFEITIKENIHGEIIDDISIVLIKSE